MFPNRDHSEEKVRRKFYTIDIVSASTLIVSKHIKAYCPVFIYEGFPKEGAVYFGFMKMQNNTSVDNSRG